MSVSSNLIQTSLASLMLRSFRLELYSPPSTTFRDIFFYLKNFPFFSFASFPRNFSLPKSSHLVTGLPNVILPAVSGLKVSSTPPRVRFLTIYVKMLIGQLVLFVNEAFCINQLTVGPGQELLRTAMEISSKMSSKHRKSWIGKLMVKL